MLNILVVGVSHNTAGIEARERVFLRPLERELLLNSLKNDPSVIEALVLSTCNRTEIYAQLTASSDPDMLIRGLFRIKKLSLYDPLRTCFYVLRNEGCVGHLLRVISGLDSIVLGEKQILGQVKEAVELSRSRGMLGKQFNLVMNIAIRCGKKAQNETDISAGGGSVSWAAVKTAERELSGLQGKDVLIIGAGKMSALTLQQLKTKKIGRLYLMNRTVEKASSLAEKAGAEVVAFMDIAQTLSRVDLCICSASAPHYIISKDLMEAVMPLRQHKALTLIDISTPRNIDPQAGTLSHVKVLTIDDLNQVVEVNLQKRRSSIGQVEVIIQNKQKELNAKLVNRSAYVK